MTIRDKIEHSVVAAFFFLIGILLGYPLAGAVAGGAIFVGREHAAAVWNLQVNEGWNRFPRLKVELEALKFWEWRADNLLDVVVPILTNTIFYLIYMEVTQWHYLLP